MHDIILRKVKCDVSRDLFKFWEISDNIWLMVQDRDIVAISCTTRKCLVAYRMAPLPIPLSDLEGHFCCLKPF